MITEDYCSFEVAKLLKKKGFNETCEYFYDEYKDEDKHVVCSNGCSAYNDDKHPTYYSMPTHQMAMKWLREVHGLSVETFSIKGTSNICPVFWKSNVVKLLTQDRVFNGELVDSYEEAIEVALKYCLENIIK
jgi:hypothetical protein